MTEGHLNREEAASGRSVSQTLLNGLDERGREAEEVIRKRVPDVVSFQELSTEEVAKLETGRSFEEQSDE